MTPLTPYIINLWFGTRHHTWGWVTPPYRWGCVTHHPQYINGPLWGWVIPLRGGGVFGIFFLLFNIIFDKQFLKLHKIKKIHVRARTYERAYVRARSCAHDRAYARAYVRTHVRTHAYARAYARFFL